MTGRDDRDLPARDRSDRGEGADAAMLGESRIAAARARVASEIRRSGRAIWIERGLRAFWPLGAVLSAFLGLALLGAPQMLPFGLHIALLAAFAAAAVWAGWRGVRALAAPTPGEARARLDGEDPSRPAAALEDALAAGADAPAGQLIWRAHQARMAERALHLRAGAPDSRLSRFDPFALRHAALIALAAGGLAHFSDGGARFVDALDPTPASASEAAVEIGPSIEAWAAPPVYTGLPPIYLTDRIGGTAPISLPEGSEIALRVFNAETPPTLGIAPTLGEAAFEDRSGGVYDTLFRIAGGGDLTAMVGEESLGAWTIEMTPDDAPVIAFAEEEGLLRLRSGALQISFTASDDYGVAAARAEIALDADAAPEALGAPDSGRYENIALELPLPLTGAAQEVAEILVSDLSEHPWAGLPVTVTLTAEDAAGQTGEVLGRMILPGRLFTEPMAKAVIEQRRELAWSLSRAERVHDVLGAITAFPDDYFDDAGAYLILRTALRRLGYALEDGRVAEEADSVIELLWQAALRLEDGDLASAAERLREIQERLSDAIERGASDEELAQLMDELRDAIEDYMAELAREMLEREAAGEQGQPPPDGQAMSQDQLQDMLDALEEAARGGMAEQARQMLQALQQMLENLQMARPQDGQGGQQGPGGEAMREMQDMIGQQQGLADRSFEEMRRQQGQGQGQGEQPGQGEGEGQDGSQGRGQNGQPGGQGRGGDQLGDIAREQGELRRLLDELREGPGAAMGGEATEEALRRADEAMRRAEDSLREGDARGAVDDQVDAIDNLREGAAEMGRAMAEAQGGQQGDQASRDGPGGDAENEDPFGRPSASEGPTDGTGVTVPDQAARKRARELFDEIRRRAGERERPERELDYLERLLDRF